MCVCVCVCVCMCAREYCTHLPESVFWYTSVSVCKLKREYQPTIMLWKM